MVKYKIYATLLDSLTNYQESDIIYDRYWGFSDNPPQTCEEFHELQYHELINRINRVPYDSEAADKGTAFNEVVDSLVELRNSKKVKIEKVSLDNKVIGVNATYNNRTFYFDISLIREFSEYFANAITQQYVEAEIETDFGNVLVYGFIDELMPTSVHDIKTTTNYYIWKYKHNSQHLVYPYCLNKMGNNVDLFEYNVAEIGKTSYNTYTETYLFDDKMDTDILRKRCESFINFIEENRNVITDKKIFGL